VITNRIKISLEATDKIKQLKTRLRIGPMYSVARMALAFSLEDQTPPQEEFYKEDGMEFNRPTLLGEYDALYISLLKERGLYKRTVKGKKPEKVDELSPKDATSYLVAHINRGMMKLHARVKSQEDLFELIREQKI
jgi:DNA sulfur modification protein DndE